MAYKRMSIKERAKSAMSGGRSAKNATTNVEVINERANENSRRESITRDTATKPRLQRPTTSIQHSRKISQANKDFIDLPTGVSPREERAE